MNSRPRVDLALAVVLLVAVIIAIPGIAKDIEKQLYIRYTTISAR